MTQNLIRRSAAAALVVLGAVGMGAQAPAPSRPIQLANMDTSCTACGDFNQYANGGWLKRATIPAAYSVWGSFTELSDKNEAVVHDILDDAARKAPTARPGSNAWKIGTFYGACMDSARIESLGVKPLQPTLDAIAAIRTPGQLANSFGDLDRRAGLAPFGISAGQDPKNSKDVASQRAAVQHAGIRQGVRLPDGGCDGAVGLRPSPDLVIWRTEPLVI